MVDITDMEKCAIKDARKAFAEALTEQGLMPAFFNSTAEVIDALILAAVTGFQASMQRQSFDAVPF